MNFNSFADMLAGGQDSAFSPSIHGIAESDSEDGEVDVYVGEMAQVYETDMLPVYETDDEGELVYDDNDQPIPLEDDEGNVIYEEQTVYDEDGNPVPVLDEDGNPVFEKVQLVDCDGEPIVEYDADGNPIAQTDDQGEPIYIEDDQGNPLPVLDENDEPVYTYDENGDEVPLYQVLPVEESQVVTVETIGTVREGETPVISMSFAGASAIGSGGWGDSIDFDLQTVADIADEANEVANATNQHFFTDTNGIHVTENEDDATTGHNILINSLGILLRNAVSYLVSITRSAIAFFDGDGNNPANIVAQFGKDGARVGRKAEPHVDITSGDIAFYDGNGTLSRNIVTRMGMSGAKIGRETDTHATVSDAGFSVENGPENWFVVAGTPTGTIAVYNDGVSDDEVHDLGCTLDGYTYTGAMAPYRVYGVFDGARLAESVADAMEAGTLDEHIHIDPSDQRVFVVPPVGEPEPEMWIISDGVIGDELVKLDEAELFPNYFNAENSVAWDAHSHKPALAHGLWAEYGIDGSETASDFTREFYIEHPNSYQEWFEESARTYLDVRGYNGPILIASAYRKRVGEINATVPLKQNNVSVSLEGHEHEIADVDGLQSALDSIPPNMVVLSYGSSTWADFLAAYNTNSVVYCRASSNSNPASGAQTRLAFMAYVNSNPPTSNVEFQYYRSVSSHTASQQGDQVYVYKLTNTNQWTVTVREASVKVAAGSGLDMSYASGTATLSLGSEVGSRVTHDQSTSVTSTSGTWTEICNVSLDAGTWVVHGNAVFGANGTGRRTVCLSTATGSPGSGDLRQRGMRVVPTAGVNTYVNTCITVKLTAAATMRLYGEQTSGGDLGLTGCITAVRIV